MWSIISSVIERFVPIRGAPIGAQDVDALRREAELHEAALAEYDKATIIPLAEESQVEIKPDECFTNKGCVTFLGSDHGFINETLHFSLSTVAKSKERLAVGSPVTYLAQRVSDDLTRIVRVELTGSTWEVPSEEEMKELLDDLRDHKPTCFKIHKRSILAEVKSRRKSMLRVETDQGELEVDLELSIACSFVPMVGDQLVLDCKVQLDESFVDMKGEVVDVESIAAARCKQLIGRVTRVNKAEKFGEIDRMYCFYFDVLDKEYMHPQVGDRVSLEAIESKQQFHYVWRCLKVVLLDAAMPKVETIDRTIRFDTVPGMVITGNLKVQFKEFGECVRIKMNIQNQMLERDSTIERFFFESSAANSQLRLIRPDRRSFKPITLKPTESYDFEFEAKAKFFGACTENVKFCDSQNAKTFASFELELHDVMGAQPSIGTGPNMYTNKSYSLSVFKKEKHSDVVPGVRLNNRANFVAVKLDFFNVPDKMVTMVLGNASKVLVAEDLLKNYPFFNDTLSINNYDKTFRHLLWLEEIQVFHTMRRYDRDRAHFVREGEYLALYIPGIAESRPSLMLGDYVHATNPFLTPNNNTNGNGAAARSIPVYQGNIHKVLADRVLLRFDENFHASYNNDDYRLEFHFSRMSMRKCHFAIQRSVNKLGVEFLFPSKITLKPPQLDVRLDADERLRLANGNEIPWRNQTLNRVQKEAVMNVLRGEARPMPYVIFGPPGTGKTSTLIETILQLCKEVKDSRLLVAAPSNSAANTLTLRIARSGVLQTGDFVHLAGFNAIESGKIPEEILPFTATCEVARDGTCKEDVKVLDSGVRMKIGAKKIGRHRITIGTCVTLGTLMQMEFARDHFTHVLIDECGQCLEPEAMIPLTFLSGAYGQVVLAGDPMQLGPVVLSRYAIDYGMATSFLVRILARYPYLKDSERHGKLGYDSRLVTKLTSCYRSLPSIMHVFSYLFYADELISQVSPESSAESRLLNHLGDILPNAEERTPNHGLYFIGIRGENKQDFDSPSWFNSAEAKSILFFLLKLYRSGVHEDEIGIITPYTKQTKVLRSLLTEQGVKVPKIGTVEEFQGQERMVILVSTVRSSSALLVYDRIHRLGFVKNSKRLNVSISRARALLVIFGNPHLLALDSNWKYLLEYCVLNRTYSGCDLPEKLAKIREKTESTATDTTDAPQESTVANS